MQGTDLTDKMTPRPFWLGLNPDKPEPLDKILAAIHCYQVAPPRSLSSRLCFEFMVDHRDHHRLALGFPELQELAQLLGHEIPFVFDPSTGKLATMSPGMLENPFLYTYHLVRTQLKSAGSLPAPAGPLAAKLRVWWVRSGENTTLVSSTQKAQKNTPPTTTTLEIRPVGVGRSTATTFIILAATDSHKSAGKYTRSFTENPNLRTIVVLQFALPMQIKTSRDIQRLAKHSSMTVFTKSDGKVHTTVDREPIFTSDGRGGAIQLWLSDMVEKEDVKKLSAEFIRGQNYPANINIPYYPVFTDFREYLGIEEETGGVVVKNHKAGSGKRPFSTLAGGSGGKRHFSTFAGSINVSPRSLPIKSSNTMLLSTPTVTATTAMTTKPFVHFSRAPGIAKPAGAMGRFLARLGKW